MIKKLLTIVKFCPIKIFLLFEVKISKTTSFHTFVPSCCLKTRTIFYHIFILIFFLIEPERSIILCIVKWSKTSNSKKEILFCSTKKI